MKAYRIKAWQDLYENADSRKIKNLNWVPMANRLDGLSYRRLCNMPKGLEIYGAWQIIVQVASRMQVRGLLVEDGHALTAEDLHCMTGFPTESFEAAIEAVKSPAISWMDEIEISESPGLPETGPGTAGQSPTMPGESPGVPGSDPEQAVLAKPEQSPEVVLQYKKERKKEERCAHANSSEEGGENGNGPGESDTPSVREVVAYGLMVGIPENYCVKFHQRTSHKRAWVYRKRVVDWQRMIRDYWVDDRASWKPDDPRTGGRTAAEIKAELDALPDTPENWPRRSKLLDELSAARKREGLS